MNEREQMIAKILALKAKLGNDFEEFTGRNGSPLYKKDGGFSVDLTDLDDEVDHIEIHTVGLEVYATFDLPVKITPMLIHARADVLDEPPPPPVQISVLEPTAQVSQTPLPPPPINTSVHATLRQPLGQATLRQPPPPPPVPTPEQSLPPKPLISPITTTASQPQESAPIEVQEQKPFMSKIAQMEHKSAQDAAALAKSVGKTFEGEKKKLLDIITALQAKNDKFIKDSSKPSATAQAESNSANRAYYSPLFTQGFHVRADKVQRLNHAKWRKDVLIELTTDLNKMAASDDNFVELQKKIASFHERLQSWQRHEEADAGLFTNFTTNPIAKMLNEAEQKFNDEFPKPKGSQSLTLGQ